MPSEQFYHWHKIADNIAGILFNAKGFAEVELLERKICISLHNNLLYACAQKCPHAGGRLSEGYIDATGKLVCPVHHYRFSLENGRNTSGEGYFLKTYPVEIRPDGVFVGMASIPGF